MASSNIKTPPSFKNGDDYEKWCKKLKIWQSFTSLDKAKQGPALFLALDGEAQDAALELETEKISSETGVDEILTCLNKLYLKDKTQSAFEALEAFEGYKRTSDISTTDFCNEFERLYNKTKSYGTVLSDDVLAFRLLKAANLPRHQEQLAKATITELTFDKMKGQLKKIYGLSTDMTSVSTVKKEEDVIPDLEEEEVEAVMYERAFNGQRYSRSRGNFRGRPSYFPRGRWSKGSDNYRGGSTNKKKGKNPPDQYGNASRCVECESINHWVSDCPDKIRSGKGTYQVEEEDYCDDSETYYHVTLFQSDYDEPRQLHGLTMEAMNKAVLDCGAAGTVCGDIWMKCYIDSLNEEERDKIVYKTSNNKFKFGDGEKVCSQQLVKIPAVIGKTNVFIETDIVNKDIPLLLSKKSMKKADTELNFRDDTVIMFNQKLKLQVTKSGHYTIPLGRNIQIMEKINRNEKVRITLLTSHNMSPKDMAIKLHRQFVHPPSEKLLKLLKSTGKEDVELKEQIIAVSKDCRFCKEYMIMKPPPRPVVGLPVATSFNQCVAMDLKKFGNIHLLHLIDHATRLSACAVIKSKAPEVVIREIFKVWISIYGCPDAFLSDNGGEFSNSKFREMCEKFNIIVKTTAAESPWSNGICERHNKVLADNISKIISENRCGLDIAVCWAINAKNSLQNVHGYSPFQLVFGQNPRLPGILNDKPPALDDFTSTKIIRENLNALHIARQAFIASESSEKIRRALRHNVRTSGDIKYFTGDKVYYKRLSKNRWQGPAVVLGQDGQQVLVKHGGVYVRVHPCRLKLDKPYLQQTSTSSEKPLTCSKCKNEKCINEKCVSEKCNHDEQNSFDASDDEGKVHDDIDISGNNESVIMNPADNQDTSLENDREEDIDVGDVAVARKTNDALKKGMYVKYKINDDGEEWYKARLLSRSGKATGKYRNEWNVEDDVEGKHVVDFGYVDEWEECMSTDSETQEEVQITEIYQTESLQEILEAKNRELESWSKHQVYEEKDDTGQDCISVRWVITHKIIDGQQKIKARLCARGFEESIKFRTDSPTCTRESVRIAKCFIVTNGWILCSIDFKTAFLQGNSIEREVYLRPPVECKTLKVWQLRKTVYGLADASRVWFLRLKEELLKLGVTISTYDQGLFYWHSSKGLEGILVCFVDDLLWGGSQNFENHIIMKLRSIFDISKEDSTVFKYIGIDLKQNSDLSVNINQTSYLKSVSLIPISRERQLQKKDSLTKIEKRQLRGAVGQMNWVSGISRPDISFNVCEVSTQQNEATVESILKINKIIKYIKGDDSNILVPRFSSINDLKLCVYADASFANLPDGGSQGGHIVFLTDSLNNSCPIAWRSTKIGRVVKSTLAAETLALVEGADNAFLMSKLMAEIIYNKNNFLLPIECKTDNKSLFQAAYTLNTLSDKRLRVEMSIVRQMIERKEIKLFWIEAKEQLANVLTKKGASSLALLKVLQAGFLTS